MSGCSPSEQAALGVELGGLSVALRRWRCPSRSARVFISAAKLAIIILFQGTADGPLNDKPRHYFQPCDNLQVLEGFHDPQDTLGESV